MKNLLLWLVLSGFLMACHPQKQNNQNIGNTDLQTTSPHASKILGTYSGTLPCADCEGIQYSLTLDEEAQYETSVIYLGKSDKIVTTRGVWSLQNDTTLVLDTAGTEQDQFWVGQDQLVMLDKKGERIEGDLADQYILQRSSPAEENPEVFDRKREAGIDFVALGNEPFWSLDIDFEKAMTFKTPDNQDSIVIAIPEAQRAKINTTLVYDTTTEAGIFKVQMLKEPCTDNMSGALFEYTVEIDRQGKTYTGCGRYLNPAYLVQALWVLERFAGDSVEQASFNKELPTLEINYAEQTFTGHTGCNHMSGQVAIEDKEIHFQKPVLTRMSCPGSFENNFLIQLEQVNTYSVEDSLLTLYVDDNTEMIFRKMN